MNQVAVSVDAATCFSRFYERAITGQLLPVTNHKNLTFVTPSPVIHNVEVCGRRKVERSAAFRRSVLATVMFLLGSSPRKRHINGKSTSVVGADIADTLSAKLRDVFLSPLVLCVRAGCFAICLV